MSITPVYGSYALTQMVSVLAAKEAYLIAASQALNLALIAITANPI